MSKANLETLRLHIEGRDLQFDDADSLEFALSGRVEVPSAKLHAILQMEDGALKDEAKRIRSLEKQLLGMLTQSIERPGTLRELISGVPLNAYSQDHGWREIMTALRSQGVVAEAYLRLAIVKYLQYLTARQEILKTVYRLNRKTHGAVPHEVDREAGPAELRETMILELPATSSSRKEPPMTVTRLPKGEPVLITRPAGTVLNLMLSVHDYSLRFGDPAECQGPHGQKALRNGKNLIGRDNACDINASPDAGDISRMHLMVEWVSAESLRLTDLSSHGTFLREPKAPLR